MTKRRQTRRSKVSEADSDPFVRRLSSITETMKLFYRNTHCKHLLFGGSTDSSYAGFLRQYTSSAKGRPTLTLLEGPLFPSALAEVAKRFPTRKFEDVFRPVQIPRRASFRRQDRPNTTPRSPGVTTFAPTAGSSAAAQDSEPARYSSSESQSFTGPITTKVPATNEDNATRLYRNKHGQRIDPPLKYDQNLFHPLKARKVCNRHHLYNSCTYSNCAHDHNGTLTLAQLDTVRYIARQMPCTSGLDCWDEGCKVGHRCPSGTNCEWGDQCRWPPEMHDVDLTEVRTVAV